MKAIYDYLDECGLSMPKRIERSVTRWRRNDLESFLDRYAEMIKKVSKIERGPTGSLDLFPDGWADPVPTRIIRQLALYADAMHVHDPILDYVYDLRSLDLNPTYVSQYPDPGERIAVLLERLVRTLQDMLQIRPLVSAGIIKFVPTQLIGHRKDPRAIYADSFYGPKGSADDLAGRPDPVDTLPKAIREYASANLYVYPVKIVKGRHQIYHEEQLSPTRMISVGFPGDPRPTIFNLFEIEIIDEKKRYLGMHLDYRSKGKPVDPETFENWVRGSKNNVLLERIDVLQRDLYLAAFTGARFLTNLPASRALAQIDIESPTYYTSEEDTGIYSVLQTTLPYFGKVTEKQIVKARENEAAFHEFRAALRKAIKEIDRPGRQLNQAEIDDVVRDTLLLPLTRVETRMKALRRNVFVDGVMLAGTLAATLLSGGNSLTAAAGILVAKQTLSDYKAQKAEEDKVKESPGFFYWDITKKSRTRERNRRKERS